MEDRVKKLHQCVIRVFFGGHVMGLICLWPPFFLIHTHVTIRFFSGLEKTFDKLFLVKEGECGIIATRGLILFSFLIPISFPPLLPSYSSFSRY